MLRLKTVFYSLRTALFLVLSGILFFGLWPFTYINDRTTFAVSRLFLRGQALILRIVCGVSYVVEGRENLPEPPYLIASQHQSTWETLFFHLLPDQPVMFAKQEIFGYPFFGRLARILQHVPVDRSSSGDAVRDVIRRGAAAVKSGHPLLVFPTGTRSQKHSGKLRSGVAVLYQLCGTDLVPVLLDSGKCWPTGKFCKYPGKITVRILPPIPAGLDRRELMDRLHKVFADQNA